MGRVLKRVPLDFKWPLGQMWAGYVNPYNGVKCKACDGSGDSPESSKLSEEWYSFDKPNYIDLPNGRRYNSNALCYNLTQEDVQALLKEERLWDFTRVPINDEQKKDVEDKIARGENSWLPYDNGYVPTAEEVNEWARKGMGHDAINRSVVINSRLDKLGLPKVCRYCNGEGVLWASEEIKSLSENWNGIEPPQGDGFQLWETTSEGSPSSPVFDSLDKLCEWCEKNATTFGSFKASKEEWKSMLEKDFVHHREGNNVFN